MKRLSIYGGLGVSCCVEDLRTILARIKNAGFFVRVSDQSLLITYI